MKREPRQRMLAHLASLDTVTVHFHSLAIAARLTEMTRFANAKSVAVYVSFGNEIETHTLIRQLLTDRRHVCVPAFHDGKYLPSEIQDFDEDLVTGNLGILEPKLFRRVPATRPEVWLVPGLAFDRTGNRVGRGKGYYDALLQSAPGIKIALTHDFQLLPEVPTESHDVRMDFIVTENQVVQCVQKYEFNRP